MSRSTLAIVAIALALCALATLAGAASGTGGWEQVGTGSPPTSAPIGGPVVYALNAESSGTLLAGGVFRDAGGVADADAIARWDGKAWHALGSGTNRLIGTVYALASHDGKVYAGGQFTDAGGNPDADNVAVWDGRTWSPACKGSKPGPVISGRVYALAASGSTLYVGGSFQNAAGIASADYLVACDLATGAARSLVDADGDISVNVNALALDSRGTLYAGGGFQNLDGIAAADYVASYDGRAWHALGSGSGSSGGALQGFVRSLATAGTTVYVGTDSRDVAGIPQADRVVKWDGSKWSALGSGKSGTNGYWPTGGAVNALAVSGSRVFAGGQWTNLDGNPLADYIAVFDGGAWGPVGSDGAGDGPLNSIVSALAVSGGKLYAGGSFTKAGGNSLASYLASYPLAGAAAPPGGGGGGGGGGTTTTTPSGGAAPPATATATGTVTVNGTPFTSGQVPYNTTVDVTGGRIVLRTDTGTLTVNGAGGITAAFVLVRGTDRGRPIVELRLAKGNFAVCPKRRTQSVSQATPATTIRQLWADGKGRYRTRGRYAAATVRGTRWLTADRCDGTQTRVAQGVVQVTDVPRNRQVTLRAGRSYLARP